jgi:hypothetical protein
MLFKIVVKYLMSLSGQNKCYTQSLETQIKGEIGLIPKQISLTIIELYLCYNIPFLNGFNIRQIKTNYISLLAN